MKKALVTGANGFVGSAVCRQLAQESIEVIAVVKSKESDISRLKDISGIRIIYCDMTDYGKLSKHVPDRNVDVMYHFSWKGSAGALRGDFEVQTDNVRFSCDAVKACKDIGCRRFVFAGSIMEYEIQNAVRKDNSLSVNTLYSTAKLAADNMCRAVADDVGVEYICGIISNIYGPGEKSVRLVNSTINKLLNGEHCSFSSGEQKYDFIYIDDAARAFVIMGREGSNNRSYYIGSSPRKLKDYLIEIKDAVNPKLVLGFGELPDPQTTLSFEEFDVDLLKREFGFSPQVSFSEGIKNTIRSIREENI